MMKVADCGPANLLQWNPSETIRIFDPRPQWSLNARHFGHRHCRWCSLLQYFCYAMFGPNYDFSFTDLKWYNVWKDMRLMDEESFWIFRDHIFTWWCFIRVPRETIYLHSCHQSHCYIILQIPWILLASKWLVLSQRCLLPFLWILHWHSAPIGPPPVTFTMANHIPLLHRYILGRVGVKMQKVPYAPTM